MIAGIDARAPGPAKVAEWRDLVAAGKVHCVFSDNEISPRTTALITEQSNAKTQTLDGIGMTLTPGPDLYEALLSGLATAFSDCLS